MCRGIQLVWPWWRWLHNKDRNAQYSGGYISYGGRWNASEILPRESPLTVTSSFIHLLWLNTCSPQQNEDTLWWFFSSVAKHSNIVACHEPLYRTPNISNYFSLPLGNWDSRVLSKFYVFSQWSAWPTTWFKVHHHSLTFRMGNLRNVTPFTPKFKITFYQP